MRNLKKSLSLILALALMVSSVFVGGLTASAALDLYSSTMTFDEPDVPYVNHTDWDGQKGTNITGRYGWDHFAVWNAEVAQSPLSTETDYAGHFVRSKQEGHDYAATLSLYKEGTALLDRYKAKANTTYEIKFKYYVETAASQPFTVQVRLVSDMMYRCGGEGTRMCDVVTIDNTTEGWVWASAKFTTPSSLAQPDFALVTTNSVKGESVISLYVDDITLSECAPITVYNFDENGENTVYASDYTTLAELEIPERDGYILTGMFGDAELTNKLSASDLALGYASTGIYYGWEKLNPGEYYAGFENYKADTNGVPYDFNTTSIVSGNTFAGGYNIKVNATDNAVNSFELRDKEAFEIKAGTKYVVRFHYRASADAKFFVGTAQASNVPATATAVKASNLVAAADWTSASVEVTLDKSSKEGFVPVFMVQAADSVVEFDHVYLTYPVEETQNIENGFVTNTNWYPVLNYAEDSEEPEEEPESQASDVWNGDRVAPTAGEDGIYIIDTAEKLAYIVYNSGKMIIGSTTTQQPVVGEDGTPVLDAEGNPTYEDVTTYEYATDCTFKLTKDIYLNNINNYDWLSGKAASGIRSWYEGKSFNGTIDGNHHTIYGLYFWYKWSLYHSNSGGYGFIPELKNGDKVTIKNLTIDYATVRGGTNAAAFVGGANASTAVLDSCIAGANVWVEAYRSAAFVGGAKQPKATLTNCASFATTVYPEGSSNATTGLVSDYYVSKTVVNNCFNANGPIATGASGSLTVTSSFETVPGGETDGVKVLKKEEMQGKNVLKDGGAMAALNATANYWTATEGYPVLTASLGKEVIVKEIWDKTQQAPVDKNGDGVYEINSPKELAYVIYNGGTMTVDGVAVEGCSFILTRDIYLNDLSKYDWTSFTRLPKGQTTLNEWYDTSSYGAAFSGTIDGNNHTVYGLYSCYDWTDTYNGYGKGRGLIPAIANGKTATVKNLNLDCFYVSNETMGSGALSGVVYGTLNVSNCSFGSKVYVKGSYAGLAYGCTNDADGVTITNCYSLATTNAWNAANPTTIHSGIATNHWTEGGGKVLISNCYNANGAISTDVTSYATLSNCYETAESGESEGVETLTVEEMKGENALKNMKNLNSTGAYTLTVDLGYPALISFVPEDERLVIEEEEEETEEEIVYDIWDGETKTAPSVGEGTKDKPFHITNGAELAYIIANDGGAGVYYQLQNDIYLNDITKINWQTGSVADGYTLRTWRYGYTTKFQGNVDGNGYVVHGLYAHDATTGTATAPTYSMGLFSNVKGNTTIKNLGVDHVFFHHEATAGTLIGCVYGTDVVVNIENCFVGANAHSEANLAGGFIGCVAGGGSVVIDKCYSLATSKGFIGSLYYNSKPKDITISNCYYPGKFFTNMNYSGTRTVANCYEGVKGSACTGVATLTPDAMKGEDVLTNSAKMPGLAKYFEVATADFELANYNNYVYLPAGTVLAEDFAPLFFDTRMAPLSAEDVMFADRMVRGAYVKFEKEVDVTKINVPVSKAHQVTFGTAKDLLAVGYFDIETTIVSENLANQPDVAVNYIFVTDPHFDTGSAIYKQNSAKQFALAIEMANEMDEIDFVVLGGDLSNGDSATSEAWGTEMESYLAAINDCTKPVFVLSGNHDDNAYGDVKDSVTVEQLSDRVISPDEWNEYIMNKFVKRTLADGTEVKVVQDKDPHKDAVNSKYYYYDLDGKNTRVICLFASDYEYTYDENGNYSLIVKNENEVNARSKTYNGYNFWGYSNYQMKWLAEEALGNLPEDYNVVVFSHMDILGETTSSGTFRAYKNGQVLSDILSAYQNKTAYTNESLGITSNFSDTGRIMSYQYGHEHTSYNAFDQDVSVWKITSSTTNPHSRGIGGRIANENAAAVEAVSVTEGYVYKQVVGHGDDAFLISKFPTFEGDVTLDTTVDIRDLVALNNLNNAGLVTGVMPTGDIAKMRKIIIGA